MRAIQAMETRWRLDVSLYVERALLNAVYKANGRDVMAERNEGKDNDNEGDGESKMDDDEEVGSDIGSEVGSEIDSDIEDDY